jgi:hypothetical protein
MPQRLGIFRDLASNRGAAAYFPMVDRDGKDLIRRTLLSDIVVDLGGGDDGGEDCGGGCSRAGALGTGECGSTAQ